MTSAAIVAEAPAGLVFRPDRIFARAGIAAAGARRRLWRPSESIDAVVREAYRRLVQENNRKAITRAAVQIGWPKWALNRRAAELGLARVKEPDWSLAEVALLRENAHYGLQVIGKRLAAAGFRRTQTGILLKRKRLELTHAGDGYSATALSKLVGLDGHVVMRWIARGMLAAERRGTDRTARQGGDHYFIQRENVRAFLFAHPGEFDLRKVDQVWFMELVIP